MLRFRPLHLERALQRNGQCRGFFSPSTSSEKLKKLERDANLNLSDPTTQLNFLRALNKDYPDLVVKRFENPSFARSEQVNRELVKALVA